MKVYKRELVWHKYHIKPNIAITNSNYNLRNTLNLLQLYKQFIVPKYNTSTWNNKKHPICIATKQTKTTAYGSTKNRLHKTNHYREEERK